MASKGNIINSAAIPASSPSTKPANGSKQTVNGVNGSGSVSYPKRTSTPNGPDEVIFDRKS